MTVVTRPIKAVGGSGGDAWVDGNRLPAQELNDDILALYNDHNGNITDANCSASMGLQGSKLADAPNGIPTAKINDNAITTVKIANDNITRDKLKRAEFSATIIGNFAALEAKRADTGKSILTTIPTTVCWETNGVSGPEAYLIVTFNRDPGTNTWWIFFNNPTGGGLATSGKPYRALFLVN
jgi:hypothetical protein